MELSNHQSMFADELARAFLRAGFDFVIKPFLDLELGRYHATYTRRYWLQKPSPFNDGVLESNVDVIGIPIGKRGLMIYARTVNYLHNHFSDALKIRIDYKCHQKPILSGNSTLTESSGLCSTSYDSAISNNMAALVRSKQLDDFILQIIEMISPGLIELPIELKFEILKKMDIESIVKMARVNHEFHDLIYSHGDPLWRHLCRRDFNTHIINRNLHRNWLDLYKILHKQYVYDLIRKSRALPPAPILPALPPAPARLPIGWFPAIGPFAIAMDFPVVRAPSRNASLESLDRLMIE